MDILRISLFWGLLIYVSVLKNGVYSHDATHLNLTHSTNTSLMITWSEEKGEADEKPHKFMVRAVPEESHSNTYLRGRREWLFDYTANQAELISLHPGTRYNVTVWTVEDGAARHPVSDMFWTKIGVPNKPHAPKIVERTGSMMEITIKKAFNPNGPVTSYQVVVISDPFLVTFHPERLTNFSDASKKGIPYYITGEFSNIVEGAKFTIGDDKTHGGYLNVPLQEDGDYAVAVGITSSFNGVTEKSYSDITVHSNGVMVYSIPGDGALEQTALTVSIGVVAALLVISILMYLFIRRYYKPRIRRPSEMHLAVSNPAFEGANGTSGHSDGVYLDDVSVKLSHGIDKISDSVWDIPVRSVEVYKPIIGYGKFGYVQTGMVHKKPQQIPVIIVTTQMPSLMMAEERKKILYGIESMNVMSHCQNVVALIGKYELDGSLHIVIEHSKETLLSELHNSRCTDFSPGYSTVQTVTSFTADQLMLFILSICKGLLCLHDNKIIHQCLVAKSILLVGETPKLSNFSIGCFEQDYKSNNTRWCAAEYLQHKRYTYKSDIWSLAVVFWEIVTLGGTPFHSFTSKEVSRKVIQGTRLPQPSCISYDLFQLMLDCWQTDPDERPSLESVIQTIEIMVRDSKDHINTKYYPGFQYQKYDPNHD